MKFIFQPLYLIAIILYLITISDSLKRMIFLVLISGFAYLIIYHHLQVEPGCFLLKTINSVMKMNV
ncbi:TPA: hypothetical protein MH691_07250 [Klebsiella pneumoniae]|nr:hypothetical protein DBV09_08690 [Klebsiella pneumoniae]PIJ26476.1 hypothetical protein C630_13260 [Klebsiella pneumoniae subsp. pneumoniae KpO3210]HBX1752730.1 hypothetical protein [Klebsiella pneumoniae subsp. pneumoniae]KSX46978.1 hypothetical protein APT86_15860 [Klebsiella pneumoniae]ODM64863.1 hypothetical protein A8V35_16245 [Klebsiella pneumoniae]